jgi:hypothetical protein
MKPDAPGEIRGPFLPISSSVPGTQVSELLPRTARLMHHVALIRSVRHAEMVHDPAVYQVLTGYRHLSSRGDLKVEPGDQPQIGAAFGVVDPLPARIPRVIEIPETMRMGARILPGQGAGRLGAVHDPFRVEVTREKPQVRQPDLLAGASAEPVRFRRRAALLERIQGSAVIPGTSSEPELLSRFQQQAVAMAAQGELRGAFDLDRERPAARDRYGRHRHGQSVLLARRLVEAGARFVTVYWGQEPQDWADGKGPRLANNPWDTHRNHFPLVRDELVPRADQALSALLEDLHTRGLLSETLVVWMGEFGRSPQISEFASREHWPYANSILMAGAGLPGGAVYGKTDAWGGEVVEGVVSPADVTATVLTLMGIEPHTALRDPTGVTFPISTGSPIRALVG